MNGMIYLDCLASVGKEGPKDELIPWTTEVLLDEMAHCGIHGGLIYHNVAQHYDPTYGNRMLADEIAKAPDRLFPCWCVMPHQTDEMPPGGELVRQMLSQGVRAARMYPKWCSYSLDTWTCGELFDALEQEEILLLLDVGEVSFEELADVATRHPKLPILMTGANWVQPRRFVPVLDRCPNIHMEFSNMQANYALERFSRRWGAQRLLMGTGALHKSMGAAKAFVDYSELSHDERALIAGGNLARLLKLDDLPAEYPTRQEGEILSLVKEGKPLEHINVIDSHAHISHDGAMGVGYLPQPHSDADGMVKRNRRMGIRRFATSAWIGIYVDCEEGNRVVKNAHDQYPDDVIGYATLDPNYLNEDEFRTAMEQVHGEWKFPGMKPYHPRVRIPYNSPRYDVWYEYGNEHQLFCLLHSSGGGFLREVADISERYPDITFLLAHSGGDFPTARERLPLVKERENVFLEITLTPVTYGVIEYMVREVGAEKVLFGTDAPMRDPIPQFGWMCYSRATDDELRLMLGGNMQKILDRVRL